MKFMLRRLRKSHGLNCLHSQEEYFLGQGANVVVKQCALCGYELYTLGWDDVPPAARKVLLDEIAKDKANEENG